MRHALALTSALFLATVSPVGAVAQPPARTTASPASPAMVAAFRLRLVLTRLGCEPAYLAAAGLTGDKAAAFFADCKEAVTAAAYESISSADSACVDAKKQIDDLRARIAKDGTSAEKQAALDALTQSQTRLCAQRDAVLDNLFAAATAHLDPQVAQNLRRIKANAAHRVPAQYLAVDRTSDEWAALSTHLMSQRLAARAAADAAGLGAAPQPAGLIPEDTAVEVIAARARIDGESAAIQTALAQAFPVTTAQ